MMPGPALARDVVAASDVDHEDLHVGKRRAEDRGEVVAATLDEDEVERALALELGDRLEVRGTSSRIAVCGQPPVSTARIRSAGSTPVRRRKRASSVV